MSLLFRFWAQQKLFSLYDWLHTMEFYICIDNTCCAEKRRNFPIACSLVVSLTAGQNTHKTPYNLITVVHMLWEFR